MSKCLYCQTRHPLNLSPHGERKEDKEVKKEDWPVYRDISCLGSGAEK